MADKDGQGPAKRPRAPTITIDTSAVSNNRDMGNGESADGVSDSLPRSQTDLQSSNAPSRQSPTESRATTSFENAKRESRPTSPHNVSSPTKFHTNEHNSFLSVPNVRPRANTHDSDASSNVSSASGTYVDSPTVPGDHINREELDSHDALRPDPGTESAFTVENNPFAFSPGQLSKLINPKSLAAFQALGGLAGIEKGLISNRKTGLSLDERSVQGGVTFEEASSASEDTSPTDSNTTRVETDASSPDQHHAHSDHEDAFCDRKRVYGDNRLPERKSKNILQLAWIAYNDKVLILLSIAAVISLALGLYQSLGQPKKPGDPAHVEWVEGVAIIVAVLIVVVVGAVNDWKKERQFIKLNKKKEDRAIKAIRSGKTVQVSVYEIFAGDVILLEPGDMIPVDGIFIEGHNVKCDESSATGESDLLRKTPAVDAWRAIQNRDSLKKIDPFILSGAKVAEGVGSFMCTAAGVHSGYGKTLMSLRDEPEITPLQVKLNKLAEQIAKLGGASALLLFVVLFIKFLAQLKGSGLSPAMKAQNFLQILIVAITIVVVAVPEGLPLAVTLALAFATTRMLRDNNLVRLLRSCETMGNATTICSDKTGTLTQNKMTVVAGCVGTSSRFGDRKIDSSNDEGEHNTESRKNFDQFDVSPAEFVKTLDEDVKDLLQQSIVINSTAFENQEEGQETFIGSKTETALLSFARDYLGMGPVSIERSNANIAQMVPFDSGRKCMAAVVKLKDGRYRMYVKGASEILLGQSSRIIIDPTKGLKSEELSTETRHTLEHIISTYASRSLRTIGLLFKDYEQWPPKGAKTVEDSTTQADFDNIFKDMIFLGIVGIQDPLRPGVKVAVQNCQKAGVYVRMVTGDNVETAKAIAEDCGILVPGGLVMEGPKFRRMNRTQMAQIIPKLCVLARSSPEDKRILVRRLKDMGETVAVTGDGTNDAPALKAADVGFSMGIAGTEVAKEASAIILMDDNFASIVKALLWGRAVNDAVRKFLQFQLTVNITAVLLTFISAVASSSETSVLNAVQLLWVNLIMDTFAALALATDPPTWSLLDRKPDPKAAPLINVRMWKMIIGQAIYQLAVTLVLHFGGNRILSYDLPEEKEKLPTLVFNTFVWMQIFNQVNNRRLDNRFNVFEGMHRNYFFMIINFIMVGGQVMIIFVGGAAFKVKPLNGYQWAISIILGLLSLPIGAIIRLVPDELLVRLVPNFIKRHHTPTVTVSDEENRFQFNPGVLEIREELAFIKRVRGGRLGALKWRIQHPREFITRSRSGSRLSSSHDLPHTPNHETPEMEPSHSPQPTPDSRKIRRGRSNSAFGAAAAMAGVVAGSIAGLPRSPIERPEGDDDSLKFSRNFTKVDFDRQEGIEVHPGTRPQDPIIVENPLELGAPPSQLQETTPAFPHGPMQGQPSMERKSEDKDSKSKEYSP